MVISIDCSLTIGTILDSGVLTNDTCTGKYEPGTRVMILKEATYDDYVASVKEKGGRSDMCPGAGPYFYLVSTD